MLSKIGKFQYSKLSFKSTPLDALIAAAKIALSTVINDLEENPGVDLVRFVLYDSKDLDIYDKILKSINKDI